MIFSSANGHGRIAWEVSPFASEFPIDNQFRETISLPDA